MLLNFQFYFGMGGRREIGFTPLPTSSSPCAIFHFLLLIMKRIGDKCEVRHSKRLKLEDREEGKFGDKVKEGMKVDDIVSEEGGASVQERDGEVVTEREGENVCGDIREFISEIKG